MGDCDRPLAGGTICASHAGDLERDLGDVPALVSDLEVTLTRQAVIGEHHGGVSAEVPMPFHLGASEALVVLRSTLVGWVRVVVEEDGAQWPADDLHLMAAFLLRALPWIRVHPAAAQAVDEIGAATGLARRCIDRHPERWYAGPCTGDVAGDQCSVHLYARPGAAEVACPKCESVHQVDERREWLRAAVEDHLGTASEISALCRSMLGELVSAAMIRGYAFRGSLAAHGETRDPRGRSVPLYRIGDVFTAAARAGGDAGLRRDARKAAREAADVSDPGGRQAAWRCLTGDAS